MVNLAVDVQTSQRSVSAALDGEGCTVRVNDSARTWTLDVAGKNGEAVDGPDPVTSFLGSLCGCLLMSLRITARARKIPIDHAVIHAEANGSGFVNRIELRLNVQSNASKEEVEVVVARAEKACYVRALLKDSICFSLLLTVSPAVRSG